MADSKIENSLYAALKEPFPRFALVLAVAVLVLWLVAGT